MDKITHENITDLDWDKFVADSDYSGFMQSSAWAKVKESEGWKSLKVAVTKNGKIEAAALVLAMTSKENDILLYSPQGPVLDWDNEKKVKELLPKIIDVLTSQLEKGHSYTYRIEPWALHLYAKNLDQRFTKSNIDMQPRHTAVIPLDKNIDEILKSFKQKTRYNINLSQKKGLTVSIGQKSADFKRFYDVYRKTVDRKSIDFKEFPYFDAIRKNLKKNVYTLTISHENSDIESLLLIHFGNRLTYFFGGFDYEYRSLMAPYLAHFEAIKLAKKLNCDLYDLWGIANTESQDHPWQTFTRFKLGFNPIRISLIGSRDLRLETEK